MREESSYRPDALSVVGARGLVQVMPATGASVAERLGWKGFHEDQLFVPSRNLALGSSYLGELLRTFDGRVSAAVAAYNAGPDAVARWLREGGSLEDDEWVESIPYDQTRSYVRRVLRSLHVYQALY
jgi:soluble lytic murein transglycosylase